MSHNDGVWHRLKRHPLPIEAFFRQSLVLTYAFPEAVLEPLLAPGLTLDSFQGLGFVAIALVETKGLRPTGWPAVLGANFCLAGYRIFARFTTPEGRNLRGLRILRSDTDQLAMAIGGNLLTHYQYHLSKMSFVAQGDKLSVQVKSRDGGADLRVQANLTGQDYALPATSPFQNLDEALHFAGPMPFTFDYEKETHSILCIKGVRKKWDPRPVAVEVLQNTFLDAAPFCGAPMRLANAFYVANIPYHWEPGRRYPLPPQGVWPMRERTALPHPVIETTSGEWPPQDSRPARESASTSQSPGESTHG